MQNAVNTYPTMRPANMPPDVGQPCQMTTIGNDVSNLGAALDQLNGSLAMALGRIRGQRPECGDGSLKDHGGDPSIQTRLRMANKAVELAEMQAKELLSLIGE